MKPKPAISVKQLLVTPPVTRQGLADWAELLLGLRLPQRAVCAGHATPLDYLAWAFFEEGGSGDGAGVARPADCVVWACRGGGKTQLAAAATLLDLLFKPGIQIRILGGSLEQSAKMYGYLQTLIQRHFRHLVAGKITQRAVTFRNGSRVEILAQSHRSVRGTRVQKLRCDEVELFEPAIWEAAQLTTRSKGPIHAGIEAISTLHVPNGLMQQLVQPAAASPGGTGRKIFRWCVWDVLEKCTSTTPCAACDLYDDCQGRARHAAGFVSLADVRTMRTRVSRQTWEQEMLCHQPQWSDAVFAAFARGRHVRPFEIAPDGAVAEGAHPPQPVTWLCGVDFGFAGAFVCLWVGVVRSGDTITRAYVCGELVLSRQRLETCIAEMTRRMQRSGGAAEPPLPRPTLVYCDIAGTAANSQTGFSDTRLLRDAGFVVRSLPQEIAWGLDLIARLLENAAGQNALTIHPRCTGLITALENYRWKHNKSTPDKDGVHDHPIDALRYALWDAQGRGNKTESRGY